MTAGGDEKRADKVNKGLEDMGEVKVDKAIDG